MKKKPHKYFGLKFYSKYFNSWCVVTHFRNDDNWYFVVENRPMKVLKAQANFSEYVLKEEQTNERTGSDRGCRYIYKERSK